MTGLILGPFRAHVEVRSAALLAIALCFGVQAATVAQPLSVHAVPEKTRVYVGESFLFRIQVRGTENPAAPDLAGLADFTVVPLGGQSTTNRVVTMINGRVERRVADVGYIFSYRITPTRQGTLTIPAIEVKAGARTLHTAPVQIHAMQPQETADFKLRQSLSKGRCYVGEPVILTVTWYVSKNVRGFAFTVPVMTDDAFRHETPGVTTPPQQRVAARVGAKEVIAEQARGTLDGRDFLTVTFKHVLIPRTPGDFAIPEATVVFEALAGHRRRRDPFSNDPFFHDFFGRSSAVYKKMVVPSNALTLDVLPLPQPAPSGFAGHVGVYRVETAASPTDVNVGDPITLTIRVSGPEYLKDVQIPPLKDQPAFAADFKIPAEMAEGEIKGRAKMFTQTLRAKRPDVAEIPAFELPYFDVGAGEYRVARTKPIPLTVRATRVVTAADAEGREPVGPARSELEALARGIAYNYEDLGVLESQRYGLSTITRSPLWMAAAVGPFCAYLALLVCATLVRRRRADPDAVRAKRAFGDFRQRLNELRQEKADIQRLSGDLLDALRGYLGARLRVNASAITSLDARDRLHSAGVPAAVLDGLCEIFDRCEAGRYAGGAGHEADIESVLDDCLSAVGEVEKTLRAGTGARPRASASAQ